MIVRWDVTPFEQACISIGFYGALGVLSWFVCVINGLA